MWKRPVAKKDSRQKMAQMVESPGFTLPLSPDGNPAPLSSLSRLLKGPHMKDGDICDVLAGEEAVVLISPSGDKMIMQNEGRATFHVPNGWRILVGSLPLRDKKKVKKMVKVGDDIQQVENTTSVLQLENIEALYEEAAKPQFFG